MATTITSMFLIFSLWKNWDELRTRGACKNFSCVSWNNNWKLSQRTSVREFCSQMCRLVSGRERTPYADSRRPWLCVRTILIRSTTPRVRTAYRSEEHTSELQSHSDL